MKAGCHLWQHPEDQVMDTEELVSDGCMPQARASFVLSAMLLAFLPSVKGNFGTWVSE